MATGIPKTKQKDLNTLTLRSFEKFNQVPSSTTRLEISYPGKTEESIILEKQELLFYDISSEEVSKHSTLLDNSFCLCDNFYGLHGLINSNKKATLIYMDPPYATGMDFISKELESAYKDHMDEAEYLEYLRRRLILSREVLSDDGSIYLHIGHQMVSHVKLIMDEVFGKSNFRNIITRRKCSSKNYTKKQYANINDFVLFYSKNDNYKWSQPGITPDKEWIEKEYNKSDDRGLYKLVPIHAPGVRNGETGKEWKGMLPPPGKHWQYTPETLDELDSSGMIHWSKNGNPRKKVYLTKDKKIPLTDYWQNYRDAHHQSVMITGYPTEKNLDMLKMIVSASSEPGDLVLDPFCGSGTTLHAARDLGRRWIGMDQSITAAKSTIKRMNSGMEKMGDYVTRKNKEPATGSLFENEIIKTKLLIDSHNDNLNEIIKKIRSIS
ncbi:site-specific DNA-methyltransferase [Citrobacter portucalensis]|uniref:site-specific DNA-methyltransferase n=3 Tax=Citrobacter portucalensis TaxID=1639133 RepID=UPI0028BF578E|nr:site-specific DNA-methyltransferase [Citrobacter portucalensis]MDT7483334.1 site-specific DNA-methyltransferase [Citrobacter portucalensis]